MSYRVHLRGHVEQPTYETPEDALDAAITLMAHGAMGVYIQVAMTRR
jgi:hypothetical protein